MTVLKKFLAANLVNSDLFNHPSILAFTQGLRNLPRFSKVKQKIHLTMTMSALRIVGHTVQGQSGWSNRDILMAWLLFLICYFGSCRARDLLSTRVNKATNKVLLWSDVTFDHSGDRTVIYLRSPKSSVGNKGQSVILSKNPEANLCLVCHLLDLRQVSDIQGPVFVYDSQFSCHSLRAGILTAMALDLGRFFQTEIRAASRWRSDTAERYVRCQLQSAESLARKVYQLQ